MMRFRRSTSRPGVTPTELIARLKTSTDGTTAIEFALVSGPFLMLLFGIIAVGMFFFTTFNLENAVEQASRVIRTGQFQQASMTGDQFKSEICKYTSPHIDCAAKVYVNVMHFTNSSDITADKLPSCLKVDGTLNNAASYSPGVQSEIALVWLCYEWDHAKFPWFNLGNMANGSRLIQASTTFRTEPYQ